MAALDQVHCFRPCYFSPRREAHKAALQIMNTNDGFVRSADLGHGLGFDDW